MLRPPQTAWLLQSIVCLELCGHHIGDEGAAMVAGAIDEATSQVATAMMIMGEGGMATPRPLTLAYLGLAFSGITPVGAERLLQAVSRLPLDTSLRHVVVGRGNDCEVEGWGELGSWDETQGPELGGEGGGDCGGGGERRARRIGRVRIT